MKTNPNKFIVKKLNEEEKEKNDFVLSRTLDDMTNALNNVIGYIDSLNIETPAEYMRVCRLMKGLTQEEFAKQLNIKQNTLSRYENGAREIPFDVFQKATDLFGYRIVIEKKDRK